MISFNVTLPKAFIDFIADLPGTTRIQRGKYIHFFETLIRKGGEDRLCSRYLNNKYGPKRWTIMREAMTAAPHPILAVAKGYEARGKLRRCKTYTLSPEALGTPPMDFIQTWRPHLTSSEKRRKADIAKLSPAQAYVMSHHSRLTVRDGWRQDKILRMKARQGLSRIKDQQWYFKVDKNGRLHHNFGHLKREARAYVLLDGERLVGNDYSAFHPHLIYSLCPDAAEKAKLAERFKDDFYSTLMEFKTPKQRVTAKKGFNSAINDKISRESAYPLFVQFAKEFPISAQFIRNLKEHDHCRAAAVLQGIEVKMIFEEIVTYCMDKSIAVITLHDSVYCHARHVDTVRAKMEAVALQYLGIKARVKTA